MAETQSQAHNRFRVLEANLQQGQQAGQLGVVAARAGMGKSTCLVQLALSRLLAGHSVLHVAIDMSIARVRQGYDELLAWSGPAGRSGGWPEAARLEVERRRHIHSYLESSFRPSKLTEALHFLSEHMDFRPSMLILDGFPFVSAALTDLEDLRTIAQAHDASLWLSALTHRHEGGDPTTGIPNSLAAFAPQLDVIVHLEAVGETNRVTLLKDGSRPVPVVLPLVLDPVSRLLVATTPATVSDLP